MTIVRRSLAWPAMILAGLALGAYVLVAWPDTAPTQPARATASVEAYPESELAGVAAAVYPVELFDYELSPSPLLDAVISAPQPVDAS